MCDDVEAYGCGDVASERAAALLDIALNMDNVKNVAARKLMLRAMELLNDGIERAVTPQTPKRGPEVLPFRAV
jgi:hypothetical protein